MGFVGAFIVIICVLGGFLLSGGHLHVLWQPFEVLIICGSAFGGMVIANSISTVKLVFKLSLKAMTESGPGKRDYMELLQAIFKILQLFKKQGAQVIERHIEEPLISDIFKNFPSFIKKEFAVEFFCDTMKLILSSDLPPYDVEDLLEGDIETILAEKKAAQHALQCTADALPGLGIVAAVLGIIHTMQYLDQGFQTIGALVAAALVGTFLGVLFCYGFMAPVALKIQHSIEEEGQYLKVIKATVVSLQKKLSPVVCVEFGRRAISPHERPSFEELDHSLKGI